MIEEFHAQDEIEAFPSVGRQVFGAALSHLETLFHPAPAGRLPRDLDHVGIEVDAHDLGTPGGEVRAEATAARADVEHSPALFERDPLVEDLKLGVVVEGERTFIRRPPLGDGFAAREVVANTVTIELAHESAPERRRRTSSRNVSPMVETTCILLMPYL